MNTGLDLKSHGVRILFSMLFTPEVFPGVPHRTVWSVLHMCTIFRSVPHTISRNLDQSRISSSIDPTRDSRRSHKTRCYDIGASPKGSHHSHCSQSSQAQQLQSTCSRVCSCNCALSSKKAVTAKPAESHRRSTMASAQSVRSPRCKEELL